MTIVDSEVRAHSRRLGAGELAEVYAELARTEPVLDPAVPVVWFSGVEPAAEEAERLRRFGCAPVVRDCALGAGTLLLGGGAHGTWHPLAGSTAEHLAEVVGQVERSRLREWSGAVARPEFTTMHKPGSDSRGVVQFTVDGVEVVAKIGEAAAIAGEVDFAGSVNALLAGEGRRALFPEVFGLHREGTQSVSLMEAGTPMPLSSLFADHARTTLAAAALDLLEPHLDQVSAWYRLTAKARRPTVADYLYRERYHVLRERADFVGTFEALFPGVPLADVLGAAVDLADGTRLPGFDAAVAWLDRVVPDLLPDGGSAVHGDIYAANMLLRSDGSPLLIDPRTVWEGRDRPDVGYGDPVYDFATLLHGVFPMAAVLHAAETGTTETLVDADIRPVDGVLDLTSLRLPLSLPENVRALTDRMLRDLPHPETRACARARLYLGAASALLGWLKYPRSLRTPQAWLVTFAYVCWYVEQARMVVVDGAPTGEKDL